MSFTTVLEHSERTGDTEGIWGGWLDSSGGREKNYPTWEKAEKDKSVRKRNKQKNRAAGTERSKTM